MLSKLSKDGKDYSFLLFIALFIIHYFSAYPGGMTQDNYDQYFQSISSNYDSHHPPLMAMLWSLLHHIYEGPQTILFINMVLFWSGAFILYKSDENNKYRWLYIFIPFFPAILNQSAMIWKDLGFANSFLFVFAVCTYYTYKEDKTIPNYVLAVIFIICFYGAGVKFQAKFITPILILFMTSLVIKNLIKRFIVAIILSVFVIGSNSMIISHYTTDTHGEQLRQFFDLAGISINKGDDSVIPDYMKEEPIYSFERVKNAYHPSSVNYLFFVPEKRVFHKTQDPEKLAILSSTLYNAILQHPSHYLKHRVGNFRCIMEDLGWTDTYAVHVGKSDDVFFHEFEKNYLKDLINVYLKKIPRFFVQNRAFLALSFLYAICLLIFYSCKRKENIVLSYSTLMCLVFSATVFLTAMACDYRYYLVVRVMSMFSLPIFIKLFSDRIENLFYKKQG